MSVANLLIGSAVALDTIPRVRFSPPPFKIELSKVIGLAGPMGAGKDTVGALLSMVGYDMMAFGDGLRDEVYRATLSEKPPAPKIPVSAWIDLMVDREAIYRKPTAECARIVLQWWGTEYRR